jgi:hypothetical protein
MPSGLAPKVIATVLLRAPDDTSRKLQMRSFVQDLQTVRPAVSIALTTLSLCEPSKRSWRINV